MPESAAFTRRGVSGAAVETRLASGITAGATTIDLIDASTWSATTTNGPARARISDGTTEEEIEFTAVGGNTLTGVTRGVGGTSASAWSAGATVTHGLSVRDVDESNVAVAETVGKITAANQLLVGDGANSMAALSVAASRIVGRGAAGDVDDLTAAQVKTILAISSSDVTGLPTTAVLRETHTWAIDTPAVESGDTDFLIPFTVAKGANETVVIERVEHKINSGTSVTWDLTVNGSNATGFTGLSSTTTTTNTDPANVTLADRDKVKPDISAVSGTPLKWEVTVTLLRTVTLS